MSRSSHWLHSRSPDHSVASPCDQCSLPTGVPAWRVRLDKFWTRVDVNLAQERVAGVNESMRTSRWDDDDAARLRRAVRLTSDRDRREWEYLSRRPTCGPTPAGSRSASGALRPRFNSSGPSSNTGTPLPKHPFEQRRHSCAQDESVARRRQEVAACTTTDLSA